MRPMPVPRDARESGHADTELEAYGGRRRGRKEAMHWNDTVMRVSYRTGVLPYERNCA